MVVRWLRGGFGAYCHVSLLGVAFAIALGGCLSTKSADSTCKDGESKLADDGCNTCTCSSGLWECTELACVPDQPPDCTNGDTKDAGDGCNICTCSGGQWACTARACASDAAVPCNEGDTKLADDGCNTCTCSGGQWACTLLGCVGCPAPVMSDQLCNTVIVYAKDPITGMCCEYGTPCNAPADWAQYYTQAECEGASSDLRWFATCGDPVCGPNSGQPTGQPLCASDQSEGAACSGEGDLCDPSIGCNTNLICASSDPKLSVGGCPISRARYKHDIEYVTAEQRARLAQQILSLPLATYRYRDSDGTSHLGFIIEDVEPSLSVDSARDRVDLYGYTSMTVAAVQEQGRELQALRDEVAALRAMVTEQRAICE